MHRRVAAVALTLLIAGAGLAEAAVQTRQRTYRFEAVDELAGTTDVVFVGDDSRRIREDADQDGDGEINASEEQAIEEAFRQRLDTTDAPTFVDGVKASGGTTRSFNFRGLQGSVNASTMLTAFAEFTLEFPGVEPADTLTFRRDTSAGDGGPWTIEAPSGYLIGEVSGLANATTEGGVVDGEASPEVDIELTFESTSTSAPGAVGAVAATLISAAILRRVRR